MEKFLQRGNAIETASSYCGVHWDISEARAKNFKAFHFKRPINMPNLIRGQNSSSDRKSVLSRDYSRNKSVHENMEATL
jgi:hypothetical protein